MPDPVFIVRGLPSSADIADHPDMVRDLAAVADLDGTQLKNLQERLSAASGFMNPENLSSIIRESISDHEIVGAVDRLIRNIAPNSVDKLLAALEQKSSDEDSTLNTEVLEKLKKTLPGLLDSVPAYRRFQKAERLAALTGQSLEAMDLICDLRPIFDKSRSNIEGMFPLTRFHITVTGENGLPQSFEVELTTKQVYELAEKSEKAKEKLAALTQMINEWLPNGMPEFSATSIPRKESSDAAS